MDALDLLGMPDDPTEVLALRQDAKLLHDGLSSAEIETLWVTSTTANFLRVEGRDVLPGKRWMELIAERCDRWLTDHSAPGAEPPGPGTHLLPAVLGEIAEAMAGDDEESLLVKCAQECSPSLAFRFMLRMLSTGWSVVSGVQYDRYVLLGRDLGFGESVVAAVAQLVRERQPAEFTDFDFGITGLASQFHQDWGHVGGPMDVVEVGMHPDGDRSGVFALRDDAVLLRDRLSSAEIENLWNASCYGFKLGDPAAPVPTGTRWMELIAERCDRRLAGHDAPEVEIPGPGRQFASAVEVEATEVLPADDVRAALIRCVRQCSPNLAFRFLLRVIGERGYKLSAAQYERYVRLGEQFGYGEFVVSDIKYLAN
ncbi:hypothetical protein [Amycolatopsis xylanica]|uniref:hypothetical protein n=1 Tax=Amycolatopsis xylanica TaxID=589385 RepID=UPI00115FB4A3|nr:hypothetical protein [Amycolatopsis xylanica]